MHGSSLQPVRSNALTFLYDGWHAFVCTPVLDTDETLRGFVAGTAVEATVNGKTYTATLMDISICRLTGAQTEMLLLPEKSTARGSWFTDGCKTGQGPLVEGTHSLFSLSGVEVRCADTSSIGRRCYHVP